MTKQQTLQPVIPIGVILLAVAITYSVSNQPDISTIRTERPMVRISYKENGLSGVAAERAAVQLWVALRKLASTGYKITILRKPGQTHDDVKTVELAEESVAQLVNQAQPN